MEAAVVGVTVVVEVEARRVAAGAALEEVVAAEAALTAAGEAPTEEARTLEHFQLHSPPQNWGGLFLCLRCLRNRLSSQLLGGTGVCKSRDVGPFLIGHKEKAR